jgi:hypothetical protein
MDAHTVVPQQSITDVLLIAANVFIRQLNDTKVTKIAAYLEHFTCACTGAATSWSTVRPLALFCSFLCPMAPHVSLVCTCRRPWV